MLLEVYRCVQLKRWSVVCGCVSSTLCRYDIRMGLLLVLSWGEGATCFSGEGEFLSMLVV